MRYAQRRKKACTEKYQVKLRSKLDREHDFDVTPGYIVVRRKLRWIYCKDSTDIRRQLKHQELILSCDITFLLH